ncbi:MAG: M48 family metalloprotease [Candidatus Aenigmatarchaeota archaeon]
MEFSATTLFGLVEELKSKSKKALIFSFLFPLFIPLTVIAFIFLVSFILFLSNPKIAEGVASFITFEFSGVLPIAYTSSILYIMFLVFLPESLRKYSQILDPIFLFLSVILGIILGVYSMKYLDEAFVSFLISTLIVTHSPILTLIIFILFISLVYYIIPMYILTYYAYKKPSKIFDSIVNARDIDLSNEKERLVYQVFDNIRIAYGIPTTSVKLKVIPWEIINAMVISSKDFSTVYITQGAIDKLDYYELEALFAHEFSHIRNQDAYYLSTISIVGGFTLILAWFFMTIMPSIFTSSARRERKVAPAIASLFLIVVSFLVGLIYSIITPIIFRRILGDVSKRRESLADISAVLTTKHPPSFLSLLVKVANEDTSKFVKEKKIPLNIQALLFDYEYETHPKIWERIEYICKYTNTPFPNEYHQIKAKNI